MLKINNLHVKYRGANTPSIQDVSFEVEKGDRVAILGPSGCGKSTTLNAIAGLLDEKNVEIKGEIKWNDMEKTELGSGEPPVIRMVFQEATLLPWRTVEKNIAFGLEIKKLPKNEIKSRVAEMLRVVGLLENAKSYPHELSVGMQQRVNFARALVCEPELLLMDEPFSALDVETKKKLQEEFSRIIKEKKMTTIFVTHNIQEALSMSDKVITFSAAPAVVENIFASAAIFGGDERVINFEQYEG